MDLVVYLQKEVYDFESYSVYLFSGIYVHVQQKVLELNSLCQLCAQADTLRMVREIWGGKKDADSVRPARARIEDHMQTYLASKHAHAWLVQEWGYSLVRALKKHDGHSDIAVTVAILLGRA